MLIDIEVVNAQLDYNLLLQLQPFSPNFSNFGPPHDFNVALNRLDPGPVFGHALISDYFED